MEEIRRGEAEQEEEIRRQQQEREADIRRMEREKMELMESVERKRRERKEQERRRREEARGRPVSPEGGLRGLKTQLGGEEGRRGRGRLREDGEGARAGRMKRSFSSPNVAQMLEQVRLPGRVSYNLCSGSHESVQPSRILLRASTQV